jgi:hypothetical protein
LAVSRAGTRTARDRARRETSAWREVRTMEWTQPQFVEVKMDAEINSYQDDFSGI